MATSYEKQMKWAKARQKETDAKRVLKSQLQDDSTNFQPQMFHHGRVKEFEGSAKEINERSAQKFIERMRRGNGLGSARSVASTVNDGSVVQSQSQIQETVRISNSSFSADGSKRSPVHQSSSSNVGNTLSNTNTVYSNNIAVSSSAISASDIVASYSGQYASQGKPVVATHGYGDDSAYPCNEEQSEISRLDNGDDASSDSESGEPIIEMLERERRQWQAERERLIQCIHLQQLEMSQRALAAHERAVDIAKDFAKLIETFETRLETVESNVQKELSGLKSITETLVSAVNKLSSNQSTVSPAVPTPPIVTLPTPVATNTLNVIPLQGPASNATSSQTL